MSEKNETTIKLSRFEHMLTLKAFRATGGRGLSMGEIARVSRVDAKLAAAAGEGVDVPAEQRVAFTSEPTEVVLVNGERELVGLTFRPVREGGFDFSALVLAPHVTEALLKIGEAYGVKQEE